MKRVYGVIGHPIAQSKSPLIHNDAFQTLNIDAVYLAFDVDPDDLKRAVLGMRALKIAGFNVTVPHKIKIMEYLDEIDEEARMIGAVNTVVNKDGTLIGYNTDGRGYVESLIEETGETLADKHVLVIGAGGAARGIVTALLRRGIKKLTITNRTEEKALPLIEIAASLQTAAEVIKRKDAEKRLEEYDIIINTTSVGMSPDTNVSPLSLEALPLGKIVSDLIYNPLETKFLKEARLKGAKTVNGVGMFVNQAALAFEYWTGKRPDRQRMKQLVLNTLGGTTC